MIFCIYVIDIEMNSNGVAQDDYVTDYLINKIWSYNLAATNSNYFGKCDISMKLNTIKIYFLSLVWFSITNNCEISGTYSFYLSL